MPWNSILLLQDSNKFCSRFFYQPIWSENNQLCLTKGHILYMLIHEYICIVHAFNSKLLIYLFYSSPEDMFLLISERGKEKERETLMWERNIDQLPPMRALTGDQTCNLGMCPDWELNLQPFGVWDNNPTNWANLLGQANCLLKEWSVSIVIRNIDYISSVCFWQEPLYLSLK